MDYSRFDHIGSSSSSDDDDAPLPPRHPPPAVRDDLEDYFRRLDERRSRSEPADAAVVPRFTAAEISQLRSFPFEPSGAAADSSARSECAICLCEFESGQQLTALPCAAAHAFHSDCVRGALAASVHCPLCRVDVRSLVLSPAAPSDGPAPASPRSLGLSRTRAGLRCLCARSFVTTRGYEQASRATAASFSGTWPRLRDRKKNTRAESPRAGNVRSRGTPGSHSAPSSLDKSVLTSHTRLFQAWGRAPAARSCTCVVALSSQSWRRVCEGSRLRDRRSMSRAVPRADSHVHTAFSRAPGLALC